MKKNISIFIFATTLGLPLFFIDGPGSDSSRSYRQAWDLGHIVVFFFWSFLLVTRWKKISRAPLLWQSTSVLTIAFISGLIIELLQSRTYRTVSLKDLLNDLLGSLIVLAFLSPSLKAVSKTMKKTFQFTVLILLLFSLYPLSAALVDEARAKKEFPLLAGFETFFEITRWKGKTDFHRTSEIAQEGNFSLRVPLMTAKYSGIALKYFPNDWHGYKFLHLSIFNPSPMPLKINCKIFDFHHRENGYEYEDRFNGRYTLLTGWNKISIDLEELLNAPRWRQMDLSDIRSFQIFVSSLPEQRVIFIDNVRLAK